MHNDVWLHIDFRRYPKRYKIGKGEQGVLSAEPYKGEILPHWRFRTPVIARKSARKIYAMFIKYLDEDDFVGADMARKFLQMGFTRSMRYYNHSSGRKYDANGKLLPYTHDNAASQVKSQCAAEFLPYYQKANNNLRYRLMKIKWKNK